MLSYFCLAETAHTNGAKLITSFSWQQRTLMAAFHLRQRILPVHLKSVVIENYMKSISFLWSLNTFVNISKPLYNDSTLIFPSSYIMTVLLSKSTYSQKQSFVNSYLFSILRSSLAKWFLSQCTNAQKYGKLI